MEFHDGKVILHIGDCLDILDTLPENSIDSVVTDPPYHLTSIVERFGAPNAKPAISASQRRFNKTGACLSVGPDGKPTTDQYGRLSKGFMGKEWDGGDIAFRPELWIKVFRVLKPGGHMVAFSGTRTYHRMAVAIEDAGFEIRDMINWVYGSGFPKSHDISKAIDKKKGVERKAVDFKKVAVDQWTDEGRRRHALGESNYEIGITVPETEEAKAWEGWGTALKPSHEDICLAQKPYTVEQNINIIGSYLARLEARLWSMLSANVVERDFGLSRQDYDAVCDFAQWCAEEKSNIQGALLGQMDMSRLESAILSSLSTVSSWKNTWEDLSKPENTSIIETELSTIIDLKTLKSLVLKITPENIIKVHKSGRWLNVHASPVERGFNATVRKLESTLELFALGNAIEKEVQSSPVVGDKITQEPICLARKPLSEPTVAANVLKWGVGAINVDACRIPSSDKIEMTRPLGTIAT